MPGSIPKTTNDGRDGENSPAPRTMPWRVRRAGGAEEEDRVAVEEPLEIRVEGLPYAVTLRSPGDDEELCLGFLFAEGLLSQAADVLSVGRLPDLPEETRANVLDVRLRDAPWERIGAPPRLVTSACGLCGRQALETLARRAPPLPAGPRVSGALLAELPERLLVSQAGFAETGGLHAAGLFDARGGLLVAREDVGRHNAVDKVVGWALAERRLPLGDAVLVVSGRAGYEIAQKAWLAGIPILVSVSAPSSLSAALAREAGMTLVAFARRGRYNVYSAPERVLEPHRAAARSGGSKET